MNKEDLILKLLEEFRTETRERFEKMEEQRKEDKKEWQKARAEDRSESQKAREEDRSEWRRGFEMLREDNREIRYDLRLDKEKLDRVYDARNQVTVSFSRAFATANAAIAGVLAVMVSMFWNK